MTATEAKRIIKSALDEKGLLYTKLTARTTDFTDLARAKCVFVKIHGWVGGPRWDELRDIAVQNGFRIEV